MCTKCDEAIAALTKVKNIHDNIQASLERAIANHSQVTDDLEKLRAEYCLVWSIYADAMVAHNVVTSICQDK